MTITSVWFAEGHPEIVTELGRVTVRWSALDIILVEILSSVLESHEAARQIIFSNNNAGRQRFRAFQRIVGSSRLDEHTRKEIFAAMTALSALYGERNAIVHEPLQTEYSADGKRIRASIVAVDRDGKRRKVNIEKLKAHSAAVDVHLHAMDEIALRLACIHEVTFDDDPPSSIP